MNRIDGIITHTFRPIDDDARRIVLDMRGLHVNKVYMAESNEALKFYTHPYNYITNGNNDQLIIQLNERSVHDEIIKITIEYTVTDKSTAISWVPASQTRDGKYKFLFSQCEAIHCRSIAPFQDTPAIKSTFYARLKVKEPYIAIASGVKAKEYKEKDMMVYEYEQKIPVQSYLFAVVVGNLKYESTGPRTGVYDAPEHVGESAKTLSEMESFLNIVRLSIKP